MWEWQSSPPRLSAASTKAAATPINMFEPVWLQITFFPSASRAEQSRLLVVVLPLVPQTTKIPDRTCPARSFKMEGSIFIASFPAMVTPCFPSSLQTRLKTLAVKIAKLRLI